MKARLFGLLALVLCAVMVVSPVAAMAAVTIGGISAEKGMLIFNGSNLTFEGTELSVWDDTNGMGNSVKLPAGQALSFDGFTNKDAWKVTWIFDDNGKDVVRLSKVTVTVDPTQVVGSDKDFIIGTALYPEYIFGDAPRNAVWSEFAQRLLEGGYTFPVDSDDYSAIHDLHAYEKKSGSLYTPSDRSGLDTVISLPNPANSAGDDYEYKVLHMKEATELAVGDNVLYYDIEEMDVGNTDSAANGIQITVSELSPFAIGYKGGTGGNGGGTGGGNSGTSSSPATKDPGTAAPSSTPNVPQTGDHSQLALWFALAVLSLAGVVLTVRRRKA